VNTNTTLSEALLSAIEQLKTSSDSARLDAEILLCHVLDCNTAHLAAWPEKKLSAEQAQALGQLVDKRQSGIPVAYLTGHREFWSLELEVSPATLIPRPETETLVEFVFEQFGQQKNMRIADLGTGSGAIAIAIALEHPDWKITATDISQNALSIAQKNADRHQVRNVEFKIGHWFDALKNEHYDLVISNPPYVAESDPHLSSGDVRFEPVSALASGSKGMDDIEIITGAARHHLNKNGWLIIEHGYDQKKRVLDCFKTAGFDNIQQRCDLMNQPRMTAGCHNRVD
jgi:release factor glutamine methyltransferase